jgi:hypothetical protein
MQYAIQNPVESHFKTRQYICTLIVHAVLNILLISEGTAVTIIKLMSSIQIPQLRQLNPVFRYVRERSTLYNLNFI